MKMFSGVRGCGDGDPRSASLATHEAEHDVNHVRDVMLTRDEVDQHSNAFVACNIAGWSALVATSATRALLEAVTTGATAKEIECALTRHYRRKTPTTLRGSRLPISSVTFIEALDATARLVGHQPPTTFGELLRLLVRLDVVKEHAGRYAVAFPPPAPEETLPLTPEQRSDVLHTRGSWEPGTAGMEMLKDAVRAEGPDFVPPAWMSRVLATDSHDMTEARSPSDGPPSTHRLLDGVAANRALSDQISRHFSEYLDGNPRACPCSAPNTQLGFVASTLTTAIGIEASCARGHLGYSAKLIEFVCSLDSSSEASVELFLQERPAGENVPAGEFYTDYVLWGMAQRSRPASNVIFRRRVLNTGLYRRTDRRPGGQTYHRLPLKSPA